MNRIKIDINSRTWLSIIKLLVDGYSVYVCEKGDNSRVKGAMYYQPCKKGGGCDKCLAKFDEVYKKYIQDEH